MEPGGSVWRHTYDERGNLLSTVDPVGAETQYGYNDVGHLHSITDALGQVRIVTTNPAGLPVTLTDELGHTTTVGRDAFGRISEAVDPLGRATRMGWTTENKPAWREHADGTRESWTWDGEGNPLTYTDQAGNITRHTATHFDVPATRTDPDGTTYAFAYDSELRLTQVTNPQGLKWSYTYDEAGRLIAESDFDGRTLTYAHDAAGSLTRRTNGAGETLRYTRDLLGRITEQRTDSGDVTTFAYGPGGRITRAAGAEVEVVVERDALGRALTEAVNGRTTAYEYDLLGRQTKRTTPSGLTSEWAFDPTGRTVELRSNAGTLAFTHDAAGRETQRRLGDAVTLVQTWDGIDRLATQSLTVRHPAGADRLLQHRTYAYRPDGYLTEIRELTSGTRQFDLTPMGRVARVRAHGWTETYAYDAAGNITHAAAPAHETAGDREFEGSLIRRAGRTAYEHDAQGRLVRKTRRLLNGQQHTWTYAWNAEDRLVEVVTPDGDRWRYTYDPFGRRTAKYRLADDGAVTNRTDFVWDGTRLAEQMTPDGRVTTWDYAPGTHRPLAQTDHRPLVRAPGGSLLSKLAEGTTADYATRFHAVITDGVGTPTELVSPDGDLVWQHRTTVWGTRYPTALDATALDCPLRFPGQYADTETGLNYNHHRYFDPETARYLSPDPLGLDPDPNPVAYVRNPFTGADPLGLYDCTKVNKVIDQSIERAGTGRRRTASGYHGHLTPERELEILKSPDGVYISSGGAERLIFHQGEDIVVMESKGGKAGNVITSYGPSGPKNDSGAAAWGGKPTDPGPPVTREQIVGGGIPTPKGGSLPPATQLR